MHTFVNPLSFLLKVAFCILGLWPLWLILLERIIDQLLLLCHNSLIVIEVMNSPPLALVALDQQFGTELVSANKRAVKLAPHLGGLAIVLDQAHPQFQPSELGLAGSIVSILSNDSYYINAINSGLFRARMVEYSEFFGERDIVPSTKELMVSVFLHEVGHANDFDGYIERAGGDTRAAFQLSREVRKTELATLPLKGPTIRARQAWNDNIDGYRDKMQACGFTDEKWRAVSIRNAEAYAELPCEKVADRFALGVLATIYS